MVTVCRQVGIFNAKYRPKCQSAGEQNNNKEIFSVATCSVVVVVLCSTLNWTFILVVFAVFGAYLI